MTRSFTVKPIYPHRAIEIENMKNSHVFIVNRKCLKHFLKFPKHSEESHDLVDPSPSS